MAALPAGRGPAAALHLPSGDENRPSGRISSGTKTVIYTVAGFAVSLALSHITKWTYVQYHFAHPLWLTITHMLVSYVMAVMLLHVFGRYLIPNRRRVPVAEQLIYIVPFSLLGAASIACGNGALVFLYPSFHQMLQNTSPLWTVACALLLCGKQYNSLAYWSLLPVCLGGALTAWGEPSKFAWIGVVVSLGASLFRALRAVLQGMLMQGKESIDGISLLYYSSPFNLLLFLVASATLEGAQPWRDAANLPLPGWLWIAAGACCAALFNLFGFLLVGQLGAVGSMVIGNLKTPTTIFTSYLVFGNGITFLQVVGFAITAGGAYVYTVYGKEEQRGKGGGDEVGAHDEVDRGENRQDCEASSEEDVESRALDQKSWSTSRKRALWNRWEGNLLEDDAASTAAQSSSHASFRSGESSVEGTMSSDSGTDREDLPLGRGEEHPPLRAGGQAGRQDELRLGGPDKHRTYGTSHRSHGPALSQGGSI